MSRCTLRYLVTVLLYAGVAIFLVPYITGHITTGILLLVGGACLTIVCGILRCYSPKATAPTTPSQNAALNSRTIPRPPGRTMAGCMQTPTPSSR